MQRITWCGPALALASQANLDTEVQKSALTDMLFALLSSQSTFKMITFRWRTLLILVPSGKTGPKGPWSTHFGTYPIISSSQWLKRNLKPFPSHGSTWKLSFAQADKKAAKSSKFHYSAVCTYSVEWGSSGSSNQSGQRAETYLNSACLLLYETD